MVGFVFGWNFSNSFQHFVLLDWENALRRLFLPEVGPRNSASYKRCLLLEGRRGAPAKVSFRDLKLHDSSRLTLTCVCACVDSPDNDNVAYRGWKALKFAAASGKWKSLSRKTVKANKRSVFTCVNSTFTRRSIFYLITKIWYITWLKKRKKKERKTLLKNKCIYEQPWMIQKLIAR